MRAHQWQQRQQQPWQQHSWSCDGDWLKQQRSKWKKKTRRKIKCQREKASVWFSLSFIRFLALLFFSSFFPSFRAFAIKFFSASGSMYLCNFFFSLISFLFCHSRLVSFQCRDKHFDWGSLLMGIVYISEHLS